MRAADYISRLVENNSQESLYGFLLTGLEDFLVSAADYIDHRYGSRILSIDITVDSLHSAELLIQGLTTNISIIFDIIKLGKVLISVSVNGKQHSHLEPTIGHITKEYILGVLDSIYDIDGY